MENMEIYNQIRSVPKEAQKTIKGGRLKGFTDINAMWRIQELTRMFGPCGIGWKYSIEREWMEAGANGEVSAFMDIILYYKFGGFGLKESLEQGAPPLCPKNATVYTRLTSAIRWH